MAQLKYLPTPLQICVMMKRSLPKSVITELGRFGITKNGLYTVEKVIIEPLDTKYKFYNNKNTFPSNYFEQVTISLN